MQKQMIDLKNGIFKFLNNVSHLSLEDYIKCIRSSLGGIMVFIKHKPRDIKVSTYNCFT